MDKWAQSHVLLRYQRMILRRNNGINGTQLLSILRVSENENTLWGCALLFRVPRALWTLALLRSGIDRYWILPKLSTGHERPESSLMLSQLEVEHCSSSGSIRTLCLWSFLNQFFADVLSGRTRPESRASAVLSWDLEILGRSFSCRQIRVNKLYRTLKINQNNR